MVRTISNILVLIIVLSVPVLAQYKEKISEKKDELKSIRHQIEKLEREMEKKDAEQKKSLSTLKQIDRQILLLNKLIKNLDVQVKAKSAKIKKLEQEIKKSEDKIKKLRTDYSRYIVWLYKQGENSTLKMLSNAASLNQAILRYKYLESVTEKNGKILEELKNLTEELKKIKAFTEKEKKEKEKLLAEKISDKNRLELRKKEKSELIAELKKDKKFLEDEIVKKRRSEIKIKTLIADLVEKERLRKRKLYERRLKGEEIPAEEMYDYTGFENFADLNGRLSWPVRKGKIVRGFGENENEKTKTVTLNYGVDIETPKDAVVHAVAEGIVSAIEWIPGYGSVVILTHKDEFRTVYGHLTDIIVEEGDQLQAGDIIGKVNENLEGNILHFEIWNERNYQNPEEWLVKR